MMRDPIHRPGRVASGLRRPLVGPALVLLWLLAAPVPAGAIVEGPERGAAEGSEESARSEADRAQEAEARRRAGEPEAAADPAPVSPAPAAAAPPEERSILSSEGDAGDRAGRIRDIVEGSGEIDDLVTAESLSAEGPSASDLASAATSRASLYEPPVSEAAFRATRAVDRLNVHAWTSLEGFAGMVADSAGRFVAGGGGRADRSAAAVKEASEALAEAAGRVFDRRIGLGPVGEADVAAVRLDGRSLGREHGLPTAVMELFIDAYHAGGDLAVAETDRVAIERRIGSEAGTALSDYALALDRQKAALKALKRAAPRARRAAIGLLIDEVSRHEDRLLDQLFAVSQDFSSAIAGTEVFAPAVTAEARVLGRGANGTVYAARPEGPDGRLVALKTESTFAFAGFTRAAGIPARNTHGVLRGMASRATGEVFGLAGMVMRTAPALLVEGDVARPAQSNGYVEGAPAMVEGFVRVAEGSPQTVRRDYRQGVELVEDAQARLETLRERRERLAGTAVPRPGGRNADARYRQALLARENALFALDEQIFDAASDFASAQRSMSARIVAARTAPPTDGTEAVYARVELPNDAIDVRDGRTQQMFARMEVLDLVTGQGDRNPGNVLLRLDAGGRLVDIVLIDNDMSFGTLNGAGEEVVPGGLNSRLPERIDFAMALRLLDPGLEGELRQSLRPYLTAEQLSAMADRIERLRGVVLTASGEPRPGTLVLGPGETLEDHAEALARLPDPLRTRIEAEMEFLIEAGTEVRWGGEPGPGTTLGGFAALRAQHAQDVVPDFADTHTDRTTLAPRDGPEGDGGATDSDDGEESDRAALTEEGSGPGRLDGPSNLAEDDDADDDSLGDGAD